jgi:hypothetical protein
MGKRQNKPPEEGLYELNIAFEAGKGDGVGFSLDELWRCLE